MASDRHRRHPWRPEPGGWNRPLPTVLFVTGGSQRVLYGPRRRDTPCGQPEIGSVVFNPLSIPCIDLETNWAMRDNAG